jgi:hypothetical protein
MDDDSERLNRHKDWPALRAAGVVALVLLGFWAVLHLLGREFASDSGLGVWSGARTHNTSQWIADPYTFSHVLHGVFFYWLLLPFAGRLTLGARFLIATLAEACWEAVENSPFVIDRYRTATASLDYYGDSILNSTFDLAAAMIGFWLAWRFNWKWVVAAVVLIELGSLFFIRDNLTLNVLMLVYPSDAIKAWQLGN